MELQTSGPDPATSSRLPLLAAMAVVAAVVLFCVPRNMADPDIWWHLRDAQWQLAQHHFLTQDVYSYTAAGSRWMNHEWLAELPFYEAFIRFGAAGLYAVTLLTAELICVGVFWLAWRRSRSMVSAAFFSILGVMLATVSFAPRTLLFGWLLLVVELLLLDLVEKRPSLVWALPPLFLLWVNTHGSWMIGLVLFALYVVSSAITVNRGVIENLKRPATEVRRLVIAWALCVAALFANPYGARLVFYPFDMAFRQKLNIANIEEWHSLDFHTPRGRILFLMLALLFLFQLLRSRRWQLFELAALLVGLYSAFCYSRFLFLAAILVVPVVARSVSPRTPSDRAVSPAVVFGFLFLVGCMVYGYARRAEPIKVMNDEFPEKAAPFLAAFPFHGNVLNEYTWGGYLIWHRHDVPVFVDSRVDIFEYNGTFAEDLDISHLRHPLEIMAKHDIRYVLFKTDHPLVYLLEHNGQWKVDYTDKTTTLLERK